MAELTPMMKQYLQTKEEYPDCILFYRLGDFYEMFFEDAKLVSKELELTLTGKACGLEERAPMCGVPHHAAETYLTRLVNRGYKVAICEQVEDPKMAKGIVKREVVRVVTPGTQIDSASLDETRNNYLMSIVYIENLFGLSVCDVSTGQFLVTEIDNNLKLMDEITKFSPSEIVCNDAFNMSGVDLGDLHNRLGIAITNLDSSFFEEYETVKKLKKHFSVDNLKALGISDFPVGNVAAGALLSYLYETQKSSLEQINRIDAYLSGDFMLIDSSTRRNLELCETLREKEKRGSLLWVLDKTKTAMGARMLRSYIEQPLVEESKIIPRYDAIDELNNNLFTRDEIKEYLNAIYDLERLATRITYQTANPRDLIAFKNSLEVLPAIKSIMADFDSQILKSICNDFDDLSDIYDLINNTICEDPPVSVRDGGIIKDGFDEDVDRYRNAKVDGKAWLAELEEKERDKTGIKNLKIKYNKVFGYYFDVTNSYKDLVPDYFIRKQTLANSERFFTPELKEMEDTIFNAEEKLYNLEYLYFKNVIAQISSNVSRIQKTAKDIATIDVFTSLSTVAERNHFVRPNLNTKGYINIKGGRHPVVEKMLNNGLFVDNDTYLDSKKNRISIITGPNMAGKSTYMRQVALIVLMAQMGSFVPAKSADISVVDRIFTRVGASDDLASGQSTFMVEMNEVANILRNATANSLLILDEIGRGTSTFDGLSIAWAVVEHIADKKLCGARTLFATHYHELTELEGKIDGVNNYCIAVKENGDDIVFLRKIVPGGADKSYGIQVAKLAGIPDSVICRAKDIVEELVANDIADIAKNISVNSKNTKVKEAKLDDVDMSQMSLFDTMSDDDIISVIRELDVDNLTPMEALNKLNELHSKVKNRW